MTKPITKDETEQVEDQPGKRKRENAEEETHGRKRRAATVVRKAKEERNKASRKNNDKTDGESKLMKTKKVEDGKV